MKHLFTFLFLFTTILACAQGGRTEKTKIQSSVFAKYKTINHLIPSLPKECDVTEYQFILDSGGPVRTITIKNKEITNDLKLIVKELKVGDKFFIENIKADCKTDFKKNYIFVII